MKTKRSNRCATSMHNDQGCHLIEPTWDKAQDYIWTYDQFHQQIIKTADQKEINTYGSRDHLRPQAYSAIARNMLRLAATIA
jgi:sugar lactone lactonase YvrE